MEKKESSVGLIILITVTLTIVFASYYYLQQIDKPEPVSFNQSQGKDIPESSYFLLINENKRKKSISSVVMASLIRDSSIMLLSYFPGNGSIDGVKSLNDYFKAEGPVAVSNNFKKVFGDDFFFFVLKKSFFESLSPSLKKIKVYAENGSKTTIKKRNLTKIEKENSLYLIENNKLLSYMNYLNNPKNNKEVRSEHNQALYIITNVVTSVGEVMFNIVLKKADHFGKTNYPIEMKPLFPKFFQKIAESDIFSLPFQFEKSKILMLKKNSIDKFKEGISFIVKDESTDKLSKYRKILSMNGIEFPKTIKMKIINDSGDTNLFSNSQYKSFKKKFSDFEITESQKDRKNLLEKSFLVNANHNFEVFNYALNGFKAKSGAKTLKLFHNSVQKGAKEDLLLYLGKDFGTVLDIE